MNLNIFAPKRTVENAFANPNVPVALALIFLSAMGGIFFSMMFGLNVNFLNIFIVSEIVTFARAIFYLMVFVVIATLLGKREEKLSALVSGLSLTFLVDAVGSIILTIGMLAFVPIMLVQRIASALQQGPTYVSFRELMNPFYQINFIGLFLIVIIVLALLILSLLIFYNVVKKYLRVSGIAAVFFTLLIIMITSLVPRIF